MSALGEHDGADGVYQILDDHITDLVLKPFEERGIGAKIVKIDTVDPSPNKNDEMVRYELDADVAANEFKPEWFLQTFEEEGFEKGLTIKDHHGESLYHNEDTADIILRRKAKAV